MTTKLIFLFLPYTLVLSQTYFDINSYMRFDRGKEVLKGAERRIAVRFRYCSDKGVLFYQSGQDGYFALGVNSNKIYIEWKTSNIVVELYVGNGNLQKNQSNFVVVDSLSHRQQTIAYVNGVVEKVDYLIVLDEGLDINRLSGPLYVGGFVDVSLLPMNTERLSAYLVSCIESIETADTVLNLTKYDFAHAVYKSCPSDFCAPPSVLTTTSKQAFVLMNITVKSRTKTHISFKFRTKDSEGLLFYIGGPAYMTLFLVDGGKLGLGLNTRGTEPGAYSYSSLGGFNDGTWKYVQVTRSNNVANVTNDRGYLLTTTRFGSSEESGFNMNAQAFYMAGVKTRQNHLPPAAQKSTIGCFEAPRFVSYSIASEAAPLLSYDNQVFESRNIKMDGCFNAQTCIDQPCQAPSQICNFKCECAAGFYLFQQNPLQCLNINDCQSNPCLNNGTCSDLILDFKCQCLPRFTGKTCDRENFCFSGPCLNGGTCNPVLNSFTCSCNRGFTGAFCETDIDECIGLPCRNGATCINGGGTFSCRCTEGFTGLTCADDVNECNGNPCRNGATCINSVGSFSCQCAPGWTGRNCEQEVNECASRPCLNGGNCVDNIGFYRCVCVAGFTGVNCEVNINDCASNPCLNGGVCTDAINSYSCSCQPGFTGKNCEININECASQPCRNGGTCVDRVNQFTCSCVSGYTGVQCEVDINECQSSPCANGGTCQDRVGSFNCVCLPGFTGPRCERVINLCESFPCVNGATCVNRGVSFTCICVPGFTGLTCQENINECASNPCLNSATCQDLINSYRCLCAVGYTGNNCQLDIDECSPASGNPCLNGGTCLDLIGRFECRCRPGYSGTRCESNIDECASRPCLNGDCVDGINSYECRCRAGFTGKNCEVNIDECLSNPCRNSGTCIDQVNSYRCVCRRGFEGANCETDINECASNPCKNNAVCNDRVAGFECLCPTGFEGVLCEKNVDDCIGNACRNGGVCEDGLNRYTCKCGSGWTGQFCEQDINECRTNICVNNATCENTQGSYHCSCPSGYQGPKCSQDVDECAQNVCVNYVQCINTLGSYVCQCRPGFTGKNCELSQNACLSQPCFHGGTCTNLPSGRYRCACLPNYMGERCEAIIRFCNFTKPCSIFSTCTDINTGGYSCSCRQGYTGVHCSDEINECLSTPCRNGGTCFDLINSYRCLCPPGFTSFNCGIDIDECASFPCQNEGVCTQPRPNHYECQCRAGYEGINCEKVIDNCKSNPCHAYQRCTNAVNSFTCSCVEGYTGTQCEERSDKCASSPCLNGGSCITTAGDSFYCLCPAPFSGNNCQISDDACNPNPCLHQGSCVKDSSLSQLFRCICRSGFIGQRCQGDVQECLSNPCQNGGTCTPKTDLGGYSCQCLNNFEGVNCELNRGTLPPSHPCSTFPCQNMGTCFPISNTEYRCNCLSGWTGATCSENVNECVPTNPCKNGGQCQDNQGSYKCICVTGWSGVDCSISSCSPNLCPGQKCQPLPDGTHACCPLEAQYCPDPCTSNPCLNSGTCQASSSSTYKCICTSFTSGDRCEKVLIATFEGRNSAVIPIPDNPSRIKRQVELLFLKSFEISFVTNFPDALIFFALQPIVNDTKEYMVIEIFEKRLRVVVKFSKENITNTFDIANNLKQKNITKVSIVIADDVVRTSIEPCFIANISECSSNSKITRDDVVWPKKMYLGAVSNWTTFMRSKVKSRSNFIGCLGPLTIDGEYKGIINQVAALINEEVTENPLPGCQILPNCQPDYCDNGGKCVDLWSKKECECMPSYAGDKCQRQQIIHLPGSTTFGYTIQPSASPKIEFDVTSNTSNGFIFYTMSTLRMALFLENWILRFSVSGSQSLTTNISLKSGNWTKVSLQAEANSIKLNVVMAELKYDGALFVSENQWQGPLYIGSLFQDQFTDFWRKIYPDIGASIIGCLKNLKIGDELLDLGNSTISLENKDILKQTKSCPREDNCLVRDCKNGGKCQSSWKGGQCICDPSFFGESCSQISAATYDGFSFSSIFLDTTRYSFGNYISFEMRSRQESDSCVLSLQSFEDDSSDYTFLCFLVSNKEFSIFTKNSTRNTKIFVSTGEWKTIRIEFFGSIININNSSYFELDTYAFTRQRRINVHVASGLSPSGEPDRFFKGCVRNLNLNDHQGPVSLKEDPLKASEGILSVQTFGYVQHQCIRDDICSSKPCNEDNGGGRCEDLWNAYKCNCNSGWVGDKCSQTSRSCNSTFCQNSYDCENLENDYKCLCNAGYQGKYCNVSITFCQENPCKNNATCDETNKKCVCVEGFKGQFCEGRQPCFSSPCLNGGSCENDADNFKCSCLSGFSGTRCEAVQIDACNSSSCMFNSKCISQQNSYSCQCTEYLSGKNCENCSYCLNGGVCRVLNDSVLGCNCSSTNFTGIRCNDTIDCTSCQVNKTEECKRIGCELKKEAVKNNESLNSNENLGLILGLALGLPLIILALLLLYCLYRREQRLRGVYTPQNSSLQSQPFTISNKAMFK